MSQASLQGIRPTLRLLGQDSHGWPVAERGDETLVVDEFGDLWWSRSTAPGEVRVSRSCWPEEFVSLHPAIQRSIDLLLSAPR